MTSPNTTNITTITTTTTTSANVVSTLLNEILAACTLEDGQLKMLEPGFLSIGRRLHAADDKKAWATALIALATRLKAMEGAGDAAQRSAILAAIALGDVELNGMLCRKLYSGR